MKTLKIFQHSLAAFLAALFLVGCASNASVVLWKHGFSKELRNNPIFLADKLISHGGQIVGIATNQKGEKFWFIADTATRKIEMYPLIDKKGVDWTNKIHELMDAIHANGGEYLDLGSYESVMKMSQLGWTWEHHPGYVNITGSRLGFGATNLVVSSPENLKHIPGVQVGKKSR